MAPARGSPLSRSSYFFSISGDAFRAVITHKQVLWKPRLCVYVGEITPPQEFSCARLRLAGFSLFSHDLVLSPGITEKVVFIMSAAPFIYD